MLKASHLFSLGWFPEMLTFVCRLSILQSQITYLHEMLAFAIYRGILGKLAYRVKCVWHLEWLKACFWGGSAGDTS